MVHSRGCAVARPGRGAAAVGRHKGGPAIVGRGRCTPVTGRSGRRPSSPVWAKTGREGVPTGAPDERGAKGRHEVSGFTFDIAKALKRKGKRHSASVPSVP